MLLFCHILAVTILQMLILSENWVFAKNINFYNVRPPLDPTPFPNSFKCFTCENAGDNYNCNRWAEDKWCPQGKYSQPFIHDQRARSYCSLSSQISFISIKLHLWSVSGTEHDNMDTQYCLTVHHFTSRGRSTSITKKCASKNECHFVGCRHSRDSEHTECRSCCEGMICNVELPTNHTNAVFAVMHAQRTSGSSVPTPYLPVLAWLIMLPLL